MPLYLPRRISKQPQGSVKVNFGHPLSLGLIGAWIGSQPFENLVTGERLTMNTINPANLGGGPNGAEFQGNNTIGGYLTLIPSGLPTAGACVTTIYRRRDSTNRISTAWGIASSGADRWQVNLPYSDGTVYFDYGGFSGNNRIFVAGLTFGNDVWSFNNGTAGLEIWQNGVMRANNTAGTQTRSAGSNFRVLSSDSDIDNANTALTLVHNRSLSAAEIISLWQNPWQIFAPSAVTVLGPSITYTYSRPSSDVTTQWTPSTAGPHYALIDETTADDADYIYATAAGQTDEVKLAAMTAPKAGTSVDVQYRVQGVAGGGKVTVSLVCNTTVIATDTTRTADGDYVLTVAPGTWAAVTDWSNMRLRFVSSI